MSTPIKDNEHIRADDKAFMGAYQRARAKLGRINGVIGVGYGLKEKAGHFTADVAILVYVLKKHAADALTPEQRIPSTFEGYRTDVRVSLPEKLAGLSCNDDSPYATIAGGIQIEAAGTHLRELQSNGTLGCIVRKRGDSGADNVYLLTCEHVLLEKNLGTKPGDGVYHPWAKRTTPIVTKGTLLGKIDKQYVRNGHVEENGQPVADEPSVDPAPDISAIDPSFAGFYADCAAVRIDLGSFCCGSACTRNDVVYDTTIPFLNVTGLPPGLAVGDLNRITDVRDLRSESPTSVAGSRVFKMGRTTGRTVGVITGVNVPAHSIVLDHVIGFRYHVIEIAMETPPPAKNPCTNTNAFSGEGDSGSLIVDERNRAVGLLYGNSLVANDEGRFITRAAFIVPVLNTLNMCIPTTTGASHGSSNATDGSGLALYGGPLELPQDDGKVLFSAQTAAGALRRKPPSPLAAPATDEQRERMLPLLDALRETAHGRELHEDFAQLSREIAYLVRSRRPVTVTWHRNRGPAFLACVLKQLKGDADTIPREIGGVSRATLLARMGKVLSEHGSNPLRDAIERHGEALMLLADAETVQECIEILRRAESAGVPA